MNEDEYNLRLRIPDVASYFSSWAERGRRARAELQHQADLAYGSGALETLDLFPSGYSGAPLLIFVHGGYWRAFDKHDFSWLAAPYVQAGANVALVNYGLSPATPIETSVAQVRRACLWLHDNAARFDFDPRRIVCSGHSAGGHLTAMVLAEGVPALDVGLLRGAVVISVLADLVPLVDMPFVNVDLRLDVARAKALSPIRRRPAMRVPLHATVGALESDEFRRQTRLLCDAWGPEIQCTATEVPGAHHMSVCDVFADPASALFQATSRLLGI